MLKKKNIFFSLLYNNNTHYFIGRSVWLLIEWRPLDVNNETCKGSVLSIYAWTFNSYKQIKQLYSITYNGDT